MSVNSVLMPRAESLAKAAQNEPRKHWVLKTYHMLKTWQHNDIADLHTDSFSIVWTVLPG